MNSAQGSNLAPIFEDLSQSEKLYEIKPPLSGNIEQCENEIGLLLAYVCAFHNSSDLNFSRATFFSAAVIYTLCEAIDSDSHFECLFFLFEDFNNSLDFEHSPSLQNFFFLVISKRAKCLWPTVFHV